MYRPTPSIRQQRICIAACEAGADVGLHSTPWHFRAHAPARIRRDALTAATSHGKLVGLGVTARQLETHSH
jgi:hypothetical protein